MVPDLRADRCRTHGHMQNITYVISSSFNRLHILHSFARSQLRLRLLLRVPTLPAHLL